MTKNDSTEEMAEERTDWAADRTIMANERTFSSWMGTALGAIGVAIGFQAVFGEFAPTWIAKSVASLFLIIAIALSWSARRQACKTLHRLKSHDAEPTPTRGFSILASLMTLAALCTGAVLWAL